MLRSDSLEPQLEMGKTSRRIPGKTLHHFVPRSYLRGFADSKGRLVAVPRTPYEVRDVHVNTVAAERQFYKLRCLDGAVTDDLEDQLAVFDALIPKAVPAASSTNALKWTRTKSFQLMILDVARKSLIGSFVKFMSTQEPMPKTRKPSPGQRSQSA